MTDPLPKTHETPYENITSRHDDVKSLILFFNFTFSFLCQMMNWSILLSLILVTAHKMAKLK